MTARIIDGKALAAAWLENIAEQVRALDAPLHLAAVCVGDDAGLRSFVKLKQSAAQSVGMQFSSYFFDATDETIVQRTVQFLAADELVHGIFIELPLPPQWDANALIALIPPEKDVDALTRKSAVREPAVLALQRVLEEFAIDVHGMTVAVIGNGRLVGQPIARWLREQGAEAHVIDDTTTEPQQIACLADLLIAGAGVPGLVTGEWVKEGATVVDFGYTNGKGDVDFDSVHKKAGVLTPVPGGMGPLVIAAVLENVVALTTA